MKKGNKPKTIEELKQWYRDRKLPPSEVTRFFIGKNCKEPKAFGIYKEPGTKDFVVYKNKASGEKVIRYKGSDEAYAVNELYVKLKEEISKRKDKASIAAAKNISEKDSEPVTVKDFFKSIGCLAAAGAGLIALIILPVFVIGGILVWTSGEPKSGYYRYNDDIYYKSVLELYSQSELYWFKYSDSENDWTEVYYNYEMPGDLQQRKTAKQYRLGSGWKESYNCSDFNKSVFTQDQDSEFILESSYYRYGDDVYYHLKGNITENWYICCKAWQEREFRQLPYVYQHASLIREYECSESVAFKYGATDFTESIFYMDFMAPREIDQGYYRYDDDYYYHMGSEYDDDWYYYHDDTWIAVNSSALPENLKHNSLAGDYFYESEWDESDRYSNFEDTYFYSSYIEEQQSYDDDDDDDYDWDDDYDSWDAGDSDWDSDW